MTGKAASDPTTRRSRWGLLTQHDFRALWTGDTASQVGTEIGHVALPVLAVATLHATPLEMGMLAAAQSLAFLIVGLPAGAWVDRWSKRRVLVLNDVLRALLLVTVPLAWALDVLTLPQLYVVALLTGICTVFFDVAYQSVLPSLVEPDDLVEGNAKLQASQSVAQVAGPAIAGGLLRLVAAPVLIGLDALSFAVSALSIRRIRGRESPGSPTLATQNRRLRSEIAEGLRFVVHEPLLLRITIATGINNLFGAATWALMALLMLRDLELTPSTVGFVFTFSALGGLLGAMLATRLAGRFGAGPSLVGALLIGVAGAAVYPASAWVDDFVTPLPLLVLGGVLGSISVVVYNITQVSFRQRLCPPHLLGRMNASIRFLVWGTMPIGAALGGVAATAIGVVPTMWWAVAGGALAIVPLVTSPLARMHDFPLPEAGEPTETIAARTPAGETEPDVAPNDDDPPPSTGSRR